MNESNVNPGNPQTPKGNGADHTAFAAGAPAEDGDDLLASLRIDQGYNSEVLGVKKPLLTVPVRKPSKTDYIRVHAEHWLDCFVIELKAEREHYFVVPELAPTLAEFVEPVRLRYCVTRMGTAFLWPVKLPKEDRRTDAWRQSAAEAAAMAEAKWLRVSADMHLGAYQPFVAVADLGPPKWPEEEWPVVVKVALRDRLIKSNDHPVVRELLGQE
jgi:hypothetical protein